MATDGQQQGKDADNFIKMQIALDHGIVTFQYNLKVDTPENVARELYAEVSTHPDANNKKLSPELLCQKIERILHEQLSNQRNDDKDINRAKEV